EDYIEENKAKNKDGRLIEINFSLPQPKDDKEEKKK
ncbi:hypothetical protein MHK_004836, partial [Candidatus Magnetomorum sp. HK-1]